MFAFLFVSSVYSIYEYSLFVFTILRFICSGYDLLRISYFYVLYIYISKFVIAKTKIEDIWKKNIYIERIVYSVF